MSQFTIPNDQKQTRQASRGDVFGEIVESHNLDLNTNWGKIKTAKKLVKILDEVDDLDNSDPLAFEIYDGKYWVATDDQVYRCSVTDDPTNSANWVEETDISGVGLNFDTDLTIFNGLLLVSQGTDITSWNGTSDDIDWGTTVGLLPSLTSGVPHMMDVHRGSESLFVTDGNKVHYTNLPNGTGNAFTITLQEDLVASCVKAGQYSVWVGTYTESGSNAYVYEIIPNEVTNILDDAGAVVDTVPTVRNVYRVDGRAVLSIELIDNIPYIVTETGNLQAFSASGFVTVASFPFTYSGERLKDVRAGLIQSTSISRPVHPKGMKNHNRSLFININSSVTTDDYATKTPSGVWEFNLDNGSLNHRYGLCETATDYGEKTQTRSGPILIVDNEYTFLMTSGETTSYNSGVFMESSADNQATLTTVEIESDTVQDAYESAYIKAKTILDDASIELKYRTTKQDKQFFDVTFINGTTCTTTESPTLAVGDEITIIEGTNSSHIAHVTELSTSATTTSIVLDTDIGTAGETVRVESLNFKKDRTSYTSEDGEIKRFGDYGTNPWIQFKLVFKGDIEMRQFMSKSNAKNGV